MTREELRIEFEKSKELFDLIKDKIDKTIVKMECFRGAFYEILPFSYQREGLKKGKYIKSLNSIKSTNGLYIYGFDSQNNIIMIKKGISLKNEFYYQFLFYKNNCINILSFDNCKKLQSIGISFLDDGGKVIKTYHKGLRGERVENYEYNKNRTLNRILIRQFDKKGNEADTLMHSFYYDDNGILKTIIKSAVNNRGYSEIIYPTR